VPPLPFAIRPYRPADARAVCAFFASAHRRDHAVGVVDPGQWRVYLSRPSLRGGRDFRVAVEGTRVVGLLVSFPLGGRARGRTRRHFRILVHPTRRRRGIGGALFRLLEAQPLSGPRPTLQTVVPGIWRAARAFYRRRGFGVVHREIEMRRADRPAPPPRVPEGYAVRPFGRPGNPTAWLRLYREAWGRDLQRFTLGETWAERALPGARAWLAVRGERPVGLCLVNRASGGRCVQSLAVSRAHQGLGLARALLRTGLRALRKSGRGPIHLSTGDDNPGARRLYESERFRAVGKEYALWRDR